MSDNSQFLNKVFGDPLSPPDPGADRDAALADLRRAHDLGKARLAELDGELAALALRFEATAAMLRSWPSGGLPDCPRPEELVAPLIEARALRPFVEALDKLDRRS